MRKVALAIATTLVFFIVAPAFSQPFADVPTDHWAFDAIAELAAKGLVEGFPDGTFKGDRAVTRYEMAMVVARVLARIEAIKIPPPPPPPVIPRPEVGRADIASLQRLINEFRAELAALGVRVTAVEEELAALRARLDNVRVTGDSLFRYQITQTTGRNTGGAMRVRFQLTGRATSNVTAVARFITAHTAGTSSRFNFNTSEAALGPLNAVRYDTAYLDLAGIYGVNWRLGRQGYSLSPTGFSGYGLLFDPQVVGFARSDGLLGRASFGGFNLEFGAWRDATVNFMDIWTGRASTQLIPGWTFGVSAISQRRIPAAVPAAASNTTDAGWAFDVVGDLVPGVGLGAAYASFSPGFPAGAASSNAYTGWLVFDLAKFGGLSQFSPSLTVWYKNYGSGNPGVGPVWNAAFTEFGQYYAWNMDGWGTALSMQFTPKVSGAIWYESGNVKLPAATWNEWYAVLNYSLAARTTLAAEYARTQLAGADVDNRYRIELSYSF